MSVKRFLVFAGFLLIVMGFTPNKSKPIPTVYLFFNINKDYHFSLGKNLDSFEIFDEDGETYTFICNDSIQKEKSIANIKFTNRIMLKSLIQKPVDRHYIIVKRVNTEYIFYHSQLQL